MCLKSFINNLSHDLKYQELGLLRLENKEHNGSKWLTVYFNISVLMPTQTVEKKH